MTIIPAPIIVWPAHVDFPLFRDNLLRFKQFFGPIYVQFTNQNQEENYEQEIKEILPFVTFLDNKVLKRGDWRDECVVNMIDVMKHNTQFTHYLFLEQDFMIKDHRFWEEILSVNNPFVCFMEGDRIHPAFALVERSLVEKTSKDFSANPPSHDHFGLFFKELSNLVKPVNLEEFGLKWREDFYHMNGLTQNYYCNKYNQPFYQPEEFLAYNHWCVFLPEQIKEFNKVQRNITNKFGKGDCDGFLKGFFE